MRQHHFPHQLARHVARIEWRQQANRWIKARRTRIWSTNTCACWKSIFLFCVYKYKHVLNGRCLAWAVQLLLQLSGKLRPWALSHWMLLDSGRSLQTLPLGTADYDEHDYSFSLQWICLWSSGTRRPRVSYTARYYTLLYNTNHKTFPSCLEFLDKCKFVWFQSK
jgi:hypothetical protein